MDCRQSIVKSDTAFLNSLSPPFANPTHCTLFNELLVYIQRISNQTFNQLLLQEHQPLTIGPVAYDPQLCPDNEDQACSHGLQHPHTTGSSLMIMLPSSLTTKSKK